MKPHATMFENWVLPRWSTDQTISETCFSRQGFPVVRYRSCFFHLGRFHFRPV